jgi:hypothetical protein
MPTGGGLQFHTCGGPCEWNGIYKTTKADDNVFHIWARCNDLPAVKWKRGMEVAECPAHNSPEVQKIASAVNSVKLQQNRYKRGSFIINEFGNVIVPFVNIDQKICVGKIEGDLVFENAFGSGFFSLNDDANLQAGDVWDKPYIGIPYNWNPQLGIHFIDDDRTKYRPERQDPELIKKLELVKGFGYVRFIVNPYGIALTKIQSSPTGPWQPVYIGRINYDKWFAPVQCD